jgi:hypothetical protein
MASPLPDESDAVLARRGKYYGAAFRFGRRNAGAKFHDHKTGQRLRGSFVAHPLISDHLAGVDETLPVRHVDKTFAQSSRSAT